MSFTAALVQMRSGTEPARNAETLRDLVAEAAARGAAYVQTPEMTGAVQADGRALRRTVRTVAEDEVARTASELAAEHGLWLHIGSLAVRRESADDDRLANRALLFAPDGSLHATYDKLHMFDVDLTDEDGGESWRESRLYAPGSRAVAADMAPGGETARLGLGICYDLRFPSLYTALARSGASVLTAPAAFTARTGRAHWKVLARARAIECGAFLLAAAQGGRHEDGRETWGHSIAVDPWGRVLGMLDHDEPGVLSVEIDTSQSEAARRAIPNLAHARAFNLQTIGNRMENAQ